MSVTVPRPLPSSEEACQEHGAQLVASLKVAPLPPSKSFMSTFTLDRRLAADTLPVLEAALCSIRLMNDARYPWLVLIPRHPGLRELYELDRDDIARFWHESATVSRVLMQHTQGHKLNVAALGNVVAQLHVHHVVRFPGDDAWPGPVWGKHPPTPYEPEVAQQTISVLHDGLRELQR